MFDIPPPHSPIHGWRDFLDEAQAGKMQSRLERTFALESFESVSWKNGPSHRCREEATLIKRQIETLQGQWLLVDTFLTKMDLAYKSYLESHRD